MPSIGVPLTRTVRAGTTREQQFTHPKIFRPINTNCVQLRDSFFLLLHHRLGLGRDREYMRHIIHVTSSNLYLSLHSQVP